MAVRILMGFDLGRKLEHEIDFFFQCKVAVAGDERYLLCAAIVIWIVSVQNRFFFCALQGVVIYMDRIFCTC